MPPPQLSFSSSANNFLQGRKKRQCTICFIPIQTQFLKRWSDQCYVRANIAIKLIKFLQILFDLWQLEEDDLRKHWFSPSAALRWWWAFNSSGSKWLLRRLSLTQASVGWTVMMTGPENCVNMLTPAVNHPMMPEHCSAATRGHSKKRGAWGDDKGGERTQKIKNVSLLNSGNKSSLYSSLYYWAVECLTLIGRWIFLGVQLFSGKYTAHILCLKPCEKGQAHHFLHLFQCAHVISNHQMHSSWGNHWQTLAVTPIQGLFIDLKWKALQCLG